jgi:hypothetical protein
MPCNILNEKHVTQIYIFPRNCRNFRISFAITSREKTAEQFHPFMYSLSFPSYFVPLILPYILSLSFLSFFSVKTAVHLDVTPCSSVGTDVLVCDYNLGVLIIAPVAACLDYSSPWRRKRHFPPKRRMSFTGLHGVISHTKLFITPLIYILNVL